jgi:hypothetical protein
MADAGRRKPGGTLASAADSNAVLEPTPHVAVVDARVQASRGVPPVFVVALVSVALGVGFLLGWALHGL